MLKIAKVIRAFFPVNLLFAHLRYNLIMIFYWLFLFAIINGAFGASFGVPYLFLSPEYLGGSNYLAFFILGGSIGGFIMAFHVYSYVQLGPKYPFIATLNRPFNKFVINNSIIPIWFVVNFSMAIFRFQKLQEYIDQTTIFLRILMLIAGIVIFMTFALLYFLPTNKDLYAITGKKSEEFQRQTSNISTTLHRHQTWYKEFIRKNVHHYYYFGKRLRLKKSRSSAHYDVNVLNQVFTQNNINASIFEVLLVVSFIVMGLFREHPVFQLPASVSIMMLLTIIIMVVSALFSWFKSWTYAFIVIAFLGVNYLSKNSSSIFQFKSYAFGLSYDKKDIVPYQRSYFAHFRYPDSVLQNDYNQYTKTLTNWKEKISKKKPKLVIINTSGGGLRSAVWTFKVMQELDSLTNESFIKHVQLITGASGGMVGAAYYRDLLLDQEEGLIKSRLNHRYLKDISKDMLNRLSFALTTNDLFFSFQKVKINGHTYTKDRGYAFEQELKSNLEVAFNHTLGDYTQPEKSAAIPTMIFSPTIINDGRRLLICAQPIGFMQSTDKLDDKVGIHPQLENVEFLHYFRKNSPKDIQFSSVLRMNATFPYIMPMVSMPTQPEMLVMDAGIRDNYGTKTTVRYLLSLHDWIKKNTSGVIILKIRDTKKTLVGEKYHNRGLVGRMLLPIGNVYGNFPRVQDFNEDELLSTMVRSVDYPIDVVTYNLREDFNNKISLSWHLTRREKQKINNAFYAKSNRDATKRLLNLLNQK